MLTSHYGEKCVRSQLHLTYTYPFLTLLITPVVSYKIFICDKAYPFLMAVVVHYRATMSRLDAFTTV